MEKKEKGIVHGRGHYISKMMERLDVPIMIKNGLRITTKETLKITQMVLMGQVQPMITHQFQQEGFSVVGLNASCDKLIKGSFLDKEQFGAVGDVGHVADELLWYLIEKQHIPIIAPLGLTEEGEWLNINADHVACKFDETLQAEKLYLLTDVPGVKQKEQWLKEIYLEEVAQLKKEEVIQDGMIPKL